MGVRLKAGRRGLGGGQRQNKWMEMCLLKGRFSARQQEGPSVHLKSHLTLSNWAPASPWCLPLLARVGRTGLCHCVIVYLSSFSRFRVVCATHEQLEMLRPIKKTNKANDPLVFRMMIIMIIIHYNHRNLQIDIHLTS